MKYIKDLLIEPYYAIVMIVFAVVALLIAIIAHMAHRHI